MQELLEITTHLQFSIEFIAIKTQRDTERSSFVLECDTQNGTGLKT